MNTLPADENYLSHYQLGHDPFAARVPNFKFFSAQRKTILGQLHHLARHSQLMLVVTGPYNAGKTLLKQALIASINKETVKVVNVSAKDCIKAADILTLLADELQVSSNSLTAIIEQINILSQKEVSLYFMVDDAECLSEDSMELLLVLAGEQLTGLRVFLFGNPEVLEQLENASLSKDVIFSLPLTPYTFDETKEYLLLRLEGAGQDLSLFTNQQLLDIYTKSEGWPGVINHVAKQILLGNMENQPKGFSADFDESQHANTAFFAADIEHPQKVSKPKIILPKKHFIIAGIIAAVLVGFLFFSKTPTTEQQPSIVADYYANLPETASETTTIPLPLTGIDTNEAAQNSTMADNQLSPIVTDTGLPQTDTAAGNQQTTFAASSAPQTTPETNLVNNTAAVTAQQTEQSKAVAKKDDAKVPAILDASKQPAKKLTQENTWYRNQLNNQFTIQVSVASNESAAKDFIKREAGDYRYFKRLRSGKTDYVITLGKFANHAAAQNEIKRLPKSIQDSKPWVRSFAGIKSELAN